MSLSYSLCASRHPFFYRIVASSQPSLQSTPTLLEKSCSPAPLHLQHQQYSCLWKVTPRKSIGWTIGHLFYAKGVWCITFLIFYSNHRATLLGVAWYRISPSLDLQLGKLKNIFSRIFFSVAPKWWYYLEVGNTISFLLRPWERRGTPSFLFIFP